MIKHKLDSLKPAQPVTLLADEENAVRYACGFVARRLIKKIERLRGTKASQFRECLSSMDNRGDDSSYYQYTLEWIDSVNRGGLFVVNDDSFFLFKSVEAVIQKALPKHLTKTSQLGTKDDLVKIIMSDDTVRQYWDVVSIDVSDEYAEELLYMMVDMWLTMRGFAITSKWMEEYKEAMSKTVKKSKSLRKSLKGSASTTMED